jgi:hypothetical protein
MPETPDARISEVLDPLTRTTIKSFPPQRCTAATPITHPNSPGSGSSFTISGIGSPRTIRSGRPLQVLKIDKVPRSVASRSQRLATLWSKASFWRAERLTICRRSALALQSRYIVVSPEPSRRRPPAPSPDGHPAVAAVRERRNDGSRRPRSPCPEGPVRSTRHQIRVIGV